MQIGLKDQVEKKASVWWEFAVRDKVSAGLSDIHHRANLIPINANPQSCLVKSD
jgi:hypothetical protein